MNICKTAGGISARTKSLREKFSSKRSYSELSFKDTLMSSTTSLSAASDSSPSGRMRHFSHIPTISEQVMIVFASRAHFHQFSSICLKGRQASADFIKMGPISGNEYNSYNILPETQYCSALDINCHDGEPRFPWQRDVAIQCNIDDTFHLKPDASKETNKNLKSPQNEKKSTLAGFGSLRFWKSSSPLNVTGETEKKHVSKKRPASVLCRTASFDSRSGYSRLIQQCSVPSSPTLSSHNTNELLVPQLPSAVTSYASETQSSSTSNTVRSDESGVRCVVASSAPQSRSSSPPTLSFSTAYTSDHSA
ncbi:uncharacterized protein B4U80_11332 [Leptotrombidium deliense]|uniref:Uncharacterized protein n=1 Tax=Leptotrombidium deliense TaxID=299467 RepID=A0A443SVR0_9ACAR|nr:uncharacterized protein B4U80_11332 [Leptotrombidium deliense]